MNTEPKFHEGDDQIRFTAEINGNPVIIDVSREVIEDHLRSEGLTAAERMEFVRRNRAQIVVHVSDYLHAASDVTGLHLGLEQLKFCK